MFGTVIPVHNETVQYRQIAQLVEHLTDIQEVAGSTPALSTYCGVEQWLAHEIHNLIVAGSNPASATI